MKKIGIIGGLGPESTIDYYSEIINAIKSANSDLNYPEIIVYSVNISEFLALMERRDFSKVAEMLNLKLMALKAAGADFAAISSNSPHVVFPDLQKISPLPLISIVETTCDAIKASGVKRPGLFGTKFTMEESFYTNVFERQGIPLLVPEQGDRDILHHKLFSEIELGIYREDTRQLIISIIQKVKDTQDIDSIILGCTEFPLILKESSYCGIPVFNTSKIHVDRIVQSCLDK